MRILCHAQHLSGVGHFVRMHLIARGLCRDHEVYVVDGGSPVPRSTAPLEPRWIVVPRLRRTDRGDLCGEGSRPVTDVLAERTGILTGAVERLRPDVVLIDHFPFSKWDLRGEVTAIIGSARACNPAVRVFSSLRDIVPQTRHEPASRDAYEIQVVELLRSYFDAILVHADPAFVRLEESFRRCDDLPVPVEYTGFVTEEPSPADTRGSAAQYAVLSCGGGAPNSRSFLVAVMEAFGRLRSAGRIGIERLHVFAGARSDEATDAAVRAAAAGGPFVVHSFSSQFAGLLRASTLSISRAGYNTTTLLMSARVPAVIVPDPVMSDQIPRAQRMAEHRLATIVNEGDLAVDKIMAAIENALSSPPRHGFDLNGVGRTRERVASLG